jgi:hypothetical protein
MDHTTLNGAQLLGLWGFEVDFVLDLSHQVLRALSQDLFPVKDHILNDRTILLRDFPWLGIT